MNENQQTRGNIMPASWKEFFITVEQMRECQKEHVRTKTLAAHKAAVLCEVAVDAAIEKKREEWARQSQPETLKGGAL